MIGEWREINDRFDAIKDHKPKAAKKLNELGEILASAYELDPDAATAAGFVNMVSVDVASYAKEHFEKSVKKTLSIPEWLNEEAMAANLNFSQILQEALREHLNLN